MTTLDTTPGTPTQVQHPWRSVVRVLVAWLVGLAVAALARWIGVDLTDLAPAMVDSITVGVWALITAAVQWLLTRPWVEHFLTAHRATRGLATGVHTEAARNPDGSYTITDVRSTLPGVSVSGVLAETDETPPPSGYRPQHRAGD